MCARLAYTSFLGKTASQSALLAFVFLVFFTIALLRPVRALEIVCVAIPFLGGIFFLGWFPIHQIGSFLFAALFLGWFCKRCRERTLWLSPKKPDITHFCIVGIGAITLGSMVAQSLLFPSSHVLHHLAFVDVLEQPLEFFWITGGFIVLQGVGILYLVRQEDQQIQYRPVLESQAVIFIFFAAIQVCLDIPDHYYPAAVYSPLDDIHSYGSYCSLLAVYFIITGIHTSMPHRKIRYIFYSCALLICLALTYSKGTWTAVLVLFFGVVLYYISWRSRILCILLLSFLLGLSSYFIDPSSIQSSYLQRASRLLDVSSYWDGALASRRAQWEKAIALLKQSPMTGSGVGSFYRLSKYIDQDGHQFSSFQENAHNYYLQFLAELGTPATILLLLLLLFALSPFDKTAQKSNHPWLLGLKLGVVCYLITILSNHSLLLDKQQILFWFVIAVLLQKSNAGACRTLRLSAKITVLSLACLCFLTVFLLIYSPKILPVKQYGTEGVYTWETPQGKWRRWSMQYAEFFEKVDGDVLSVPFNLHTPHIEDKGVGIQLHINDELVGSQRFFTNDLHRIQAYVPGVAGTSPKITLSLDRTFSPLLDNISTDKRLLGAWLAPIQTQQQLTKDGVGFFAWHILPQKAAPWATNDMRYRWTGLQASLPMLERKTLSLAVFPGHPDLHIRPATVSFFVNATLVAKHKFTSNHWERVDISAPSKTANNIVTIKVDRTWISGIKSGADGYELGVSTVILK